MRKQVKVKLKGRSVLVAHSTSNSLPFMFYLLQKESENVIGKTCSFVRKEQVTLYRKA